MKQHHIWTENEVERWIPWSTYAPNLIHIFSLVIQLDSAKNRKFGYSLIIIGLKLMKKHRILTESGVERRILTIRTKIWWSIMIKLCLNFPFPSIFWWKNITFWLKMIFQQVGVILWTKCLALSWILVHVDQNKKPL